MDSTNDSQNKRKSVKSKLEQNGLMQARINNYMDNRHHARYGRSTIHRNIVVGDTSKDQQQNINNNVDSINHDDGKDYTATQLTGESKDNSTSDSTSESIDHTMDQTHDISQNSISCDPDVNDDYNSQYMDFYNVLALHRNEVLTDFYKFTTSPVEFMSQIITNQLYIMLEDAEMFQCTPEQITEMLDITHKILERTSIQVQQ